MFVMDELNYDRYNTKHERIFRVTSDVKLSNQTDVISMSSFLLGPTLKQEYPEVEDAVRLMPVGKQTIWHGTQVHQLDEIFFTDSGFFNMFDYQFLAGNSKTALYEPYSIVLTDRTAIKFFGSPDSALNKMLKFTRASYKVTGVVRERRYNSHITFHALISISSLPPSFEEQLKSDWLYMAQANYVLLKEPSSTAQFEQHLIEVRKNKIDSQLIRDKVKGSITFHLQPLSDIHLNTTYSFEYAKVSKRSYIYIFSIVALFILVLACINYMNLATARSSKRAKEVGIRKTSGANWSQLFYQFIGESFIITLIAVAFAICLVELLLPSFNNLTEKNLGLTAFADSKVLFSLFSMLVLVGFFAGAYPAVVLSRYQPILALKNNQPGKGGNILIRKGLVIFQFGISIILIICTLVVFMQMQFMKNKDMGFNKAQTLVIKVPLPDSVLVSQLSEIKRELLQSPYITKVAASNELPGIDGGMLMQYVNYEGKTEERMMHTMSVDYDLFDLLDIKLIEGRSFSRDIKLDDTAAFIVNEAAVKKLGWTKPEKVSIENSLGYKGKIVGVVKDFNFQSLHHPVEPLLIMLSPNRAAHMLLKLSHPDDAHVIPFIEKTWKKYSKKYPMEYFFLDQNFEQLYKTEERLLLVFSYFSLLTIIIACLGLFGLAAYSVENRTKEIGVRKAMGASVRGIVTLISSDFAILVLLSFIIAFPVAWYVMQNWLNDFAHRIQLGWQPFVFAGFLALLVAILTVSILAVRAAVRNPVVSLRYE